MRPRNGPSMHEKSIARLSDAALLRRLATLVIRDRMNTAALLAHIAEVDTRRLYASAGYSSMHAYCVDELHMSDDAAFRRIRAARAARKFPTILTEVAAGRLHLAAVSLLAPHLTAENADELISAATHRRKAEIETMLALRFPVLDPAAVPRTTIRPLIGSQLVPGRVPSAQLDLAESHAPVSIAAATAGSEEPSSPSLDARGDFFPSAPHVDESRRPVGPVGPVEPPTPLPALPNLASVSPARFVLRLTISKSTRDKLTHAQTLLSHALGTTDVAQVLDRALDSLIASLEKRKFSETRRPRSRPRTRSASRRRAIPAHVRRAVWTRDQGRCTFVGSRGHRCGERHHLEFDHVDPVARGGRATVERMRLRCRTHNQYEAERVFGADFMKSKRLQAKNARSTSPSQRNGQPKRRSSP